MLAALATAALPTLSLVLAVAACSKARSPQSVDRAFAQLRVPQALSAAWMRRAFPWAELALAIALLAGWGWPLVVAAAAAVALTAAYLVLVVRAALAPTPVDCGCFGETSARPVDRWTVVRNLVLLALAVLALVTVLDPQLRGEAWPLLALAHPGPLAAAAATGLVVLALGRNGDLAPAAAEAPAAQASADAAPATAAEEQPDEPVADYVRTPIPFHALRLPDGEIRSLRRLALHGGVFLLYASKGCGPCEEVLARVDELRAAVAPLRLLVVHPVGTTPEAAAEFDAAIDLGDGLHAVLAVHGRPFAVLLGVDGLLAGGPELGPDAIMDLARQVRAQLDEAGLTADVDLPGSAHGAGAGSA